MLILGDEGHYHGRFPWVTTTLIVTNILVFLGQATVGEPFTNGFSCVPEEITSGKDLVGTKYHKVKVATGIRYDRKGEAHYKLETKQFPIKHYTGPFPIHLTLLTSIFMHGDVWHLIGNMWFLLIFGRNVECAMGHGRFIAFYLACGLAASAAHVASDLHSIIPCLGASGAISGTMGAYVSIHPLNKIKVWFGWYFGVFEVPAIIIIGIWFVLQYVSAFVGLEDEMYRDNVAYWAHLGGFCAGFVILRGMVFYLQRQAAAGEQEDEEPLAPVEETFNSKEPAEEVANPLETVGAKEGENDPFATFLSVQAVRRMQQDQAEKEKTASR